MKNALIQIAILNEHTIGYIYPETPKQMNVLRAIERKGATFTTNTVYNVQLSTKDQIRLATRADFEEYRINFEQYENRTDEYLFNS